MDAQRSKLTNQLLGLTSNQMGGVNIVHNYKLTLENCYAPMLWGSQNYMKTRLGHQLGHKS